ncbi:MAG TPA: hypothetical protein C5S37_12605 [Methanophagales archaeon]|nr:hypothetical protein [Methanophagales archaeon]
MEKGKMAKNKLIRTTIIPLSVAALVVLLSLMGDPFRVEGRGASTYWACVQTIFVFILPAVPIIYGGITKDKIGAILIGVLPFFGLFISSFIIGHSGLADVRLPQIREFLYMLSLIGIPGIEGYFAARREILPLLIAICLYILWFRIFLLGIH